MSHDNNSGQGNFNKISQTIWKIADHLRGSWKQHEYQDVILPLLVLKRLDSILADSKSKVLETANKFEGQITLDPILKKASGLGFYNTSPYDFHKLLDEPQHIAKNLRNYIGGFSENIKEIFSKFDFERQLERLEGGNLLFLIIKEFNQVDLSPSAVDNHEMGTIFERLIQKFNEQSNETAGEHYTPRDVIKTMVEVLFAPDRERLKKEHIIKTIYDCACGTGGMLTVSKEHIIDSDNPINAKADIYLYGQELNPVTYAVCKADMLIKGEDPDKIKGGEKDHSKASTLSNDQFLGEKFDYCLTNPPFGVDWKKDKEAVEREAERGYTGRFGAGTPRISDGQFLFLQHLISKMRKPEDGGSRIAIVMNGSPLFTGDAGSGESEIRRWILEHDWLEAIVALPDQMFFNTGINTYLWFLTNRKEKNREKKVQLIDARTFFGQMRKSLGNKRHEITDENRNKIKELYETFEENEYCKIFNVTDFAYRQITVERPLRLNFSATDEKVEQLKNSGFFEKLDREDSGKMIASLSGMKKGIVYKNRNQFEDTFFKTVSGKFFSTGVMKKVIDAFGERDESADIRTDKDGHPESDSDLRDYENVPWGQDIKGYFEKEVKPYVSDAWIDATVVDSKDGKLGKVGYEIPFTRYFYKYQSPRELDAIETDIETIEADLLKLLKQI
jgi:type I restriction enzyme M protein